MRLVNIVQLFKNPLKVVYILGKREYLNFLTDKFYLKLVYRSFFHKKLNISNPQTFNEKIQWLKLYDRNPLYLHLVDKFDVRKIVADKIGEEYLIPIIGCWNSFEDIDFTIFPEKFVLKCTHDSGSVYICTDKAKFDKNSAKEAMNKYLKHNFYYTGREWSYKNLTPRIIAEEYLPMISPEDSNDYKFMCFNGFVKCSFVCSNRFEKDGLKVTFYDREWNMMPFERHYPASEYAIPKPFHYDRMVELAEILSKDIPFVRVDFYCCQNKIYFGELTFYPGDGFEEFSPESYDLLLGSWIELPEKD